MSAHEHVLGKVVSRAQHPYRHSFSEMSYTSEAMPGVINAQQAMDWLIAAIYPNPKAAVDTPGDLPAVGNSIGDYRIVTDDGDGNAAGYQWQQREGDVAAQWYKIYDLDWGVGTIVSSYLSKTIDHYVYRHGFDDLDETGTALTGVDAGQHVYGGASANTHLTLHANSGDGTGGQTGYVQVADNFRPQTDSAWLCGTNTERWLGMFTDTITSGTMTMTSGSITDTSGAISFGNENLSTTGTIGGGAITGTSFVAGTLTVSDGSIVDTDGSISLSSTNLTTNGTMGCGRLEAYNVHITQNYIETNTGNLNLRLIPHGTGKVSVEKAMTTLDITTTGLINVDNLRFDGNTITSTDAAGSINIHPDTTGQINLHDGVLTIQSSGAVAITGDLAVDNLSLNGNTLSSTDVNGNIVFSPNGTGFIQVTSTIDVDTDNSYDLGATLTRFQDLYLSGGVRDGTNETPIAVIIALRDILTGINTGDAIFWDGSKFVASNPDAEIDHGELLGASLSDDDHTQYALLAGRSGGQTLIGGTGAGDNLLLESTSNVTKGQILIGDDLYPDADGQHDLGASGSQWDDLYMTGEGIGFRIQNFADATARAAATGTEGRLGWQVDTEELYIGTGAAWKQISTDAYYNEDASGWTGSVATVTYDVSSYTDDAKKMIWQFKDNTNNYEIMAPVIDHPTSTQVRVTFGMNLTAGTYTLVGR